jgi:transcriptional regulator with XRE-family HTH domain
MMTAEQLRAARALLRIEQLDLATRSGVSLATIKRFESMDGPIKARTKTVELLRAALDALGVIFIPKNGDDVGVRLRKPRRGSC